MGLSLERLEMLEVLARSNRMKTLSLTVRTADIAMTNTEAVVV